MIRARPGSARSLAAVAAAAMLLLSSGCGGEGSDDDAGLPNPAAVYCEEQGGTASGPEPMCRLPGGSVVDAWELYRSDHPSED